MTPGTGTPDLAASTIRLRSRRQPGFRERAWPPTSLLAFTVVLAGCVGVPPVSDSEQNPASDAVVSAPASPSSSEIARDGIHPHPLNDRHPWVSENRAAFVMPGGDMVSLLAKSQPDKDAFRQFDAWARIRAGLSLPHPLHSRVQHEIDWYRRNQEYLQRLAQRARPYLGYIAREVERRDMPMEFALLPVVESAFRVYAYSPAGASGLWQFIPSTGRLYGLKQNWWYDGRRDVVASTHAALDYLTKLLRDFDGDRLLAVAAYNWGEGNVRRAISRNRARGKPTDVWSLRLPRETRSHVSRLLAIAFIVEDPSRYGVVLESIPDSVQFQQVALEGQIDLSVAADLAGITLDELRQLNPGFKRWATDPGGPHWLQLPSGTANRFKSRLAEAPVGNRMHWARHKIERGETLGSIAGRYRTSVAVLKDINRLSSDRIRAGRHLLVPASNGTLATQPLGQTMQTRFGPSTPLDPVRSVHRVRRGENLWRIAGIHGVSVKQLVAWNGLSLKRVLRPGQRLSIYRRDTGAPQIAPPEAVADRLKAASRPAVIHVVERGDTLSGIAKRHGTTVLELTEFNRINKSAVLQPGQKLRVVPAVYSTAPADRKKIRYRVQRGDSLWEIAQRFGVSVASLREWNQLPKGVLLMPGHELDVRLTQAPAI